MRVVKTIEEMSAISRKAHKSAKRIGFVPTMGYLHDGHMSLIRAAQKDCDIVVVSIFVNPAQFGPNEDLKKYPRNIARDKKMCEDNGVDIIFAPSVKEMYPGVFNTFVDIGRALTRGLCGRTRPGHFRGVATVVAKLFNIIMPSVSYFGQKDAQQALVIKRMASDLNFSGKIKVMPIVREKDGLAMSSRNVYLSAAERRKALAISKALGYAVKLVKTGVRSVPYIEKEMKKIIVGKNKDVRIDYVEIVDIPDLKPLKTIKNKTLIAVACFVGGTRLIDNAIVRTPN